MKHKVLIPLFSALLICTLVLIILILNSRWNSKIESYENMVILNQKELTAMRNTQELLKQNTYQVRKYMNLPELNFDTEEDSESDIPDAGSFELAAYDAISYLEEFNSSQEMLKEYTSLLGSENFQSLLRVLNLDYRKSSDFEGVLLKERSPYFKIVYIPDEKRFLIQSYIGDSEVRDSLESKEAVAFLQSETRKLNTLYERVDRLNRDLLQIYSDRNLRNELKKFNLYLGESAFSGKNRFIPILRIDDSELLRIVTDTEHSLFILGNYKYEDLETLKQGLIDYINHNDIRTASERTDDLVEKEIVALLSDPAFKQRLDDLGFTPIMQPREDNDYIYYDFVNEQSLRQGALALQKEFGEVYLMDGDDIPVRSLKTFTVNHELTFNFQLEQMKSESSVSDTFVPAQGSETFLLIGSHEHNADTMILLHGDSETSQLRMLSIPRDLYYEGRKINSIYREFGPQRLVSELSSLTGLSITKYIAIDMYAFIDVVNLLGGIDVRLDEALVDPTYKVRENGRWSTLYYTAGTHHLDGIAALRIARSRHTSSDFERAVRQQKVIAALKDKAVNMNFTDMNKIYELIRITGKYVQTNLSTTDMVKYFLSYKDYNIAGQHVMNTDNVLYASYTNLYRLSDEEQRAALEDESFYKGGWIVLPKDNDWTIIKTYIRSVLTGS
ncbi:LytR family transcriptional regulator [Oceanispirochaeta crateris]|uniref:LytR family transcriptional regulator n=1 Tax=Oceanispirochaeta crateris TaxID=2518645 RepID=A0A5C1QK36_9SPIO|nr:LCP family protein [Oceanispirochaeta crateris]QEN07688.1 LytR family transcriptional regulator [Oceanispirochaeta crateris]